MTPAATLAKAIQFEIFSTYVCQEYLGQGFYRAAQTTGELTLESVGLSHDDAVLQIDQYEKFALAELAKHSGGPLAGVPKSGRQNVCIDLTNKAQHDRQVAAAILRKSLGKD